MQLAASPPNEHTSEGGRDDRGVPYPVLKCSSSQQIKGLALNSLHIGTCVTWMWTRTHARRTRSPHLNPLMVGKKRAVESDGMSKRAIAELYRYRSTYRLGDLIYGYIDQRHGRSPLTNPPRSIYCSTWPTSLGCAFVRSNASADTRGSGLKTLCHLARDMQPRLRPRPSSLVVHLRLGDVLDYSYWREQRAGGGCSWRKGPAAC